MPKDTGIGAPMKRREDIRFLTGRGVYTDDLKLAGQTYAVFVRSQISEEDASKIGRVKKLVGMTALAGILLLAAYLKMFQCLQMIYVLPMTKLTA